MNAVVFFFLPLRKPKVRAFSHSPKSQHFWMVEQSWKARHALSYNHELLPYLSQALLMASILTAHPQQQVPAEQLSPFDSLSR